MPSRRALLFGVLAGAPGLATSALAQQPEPKQPAVIPPIEVVATRRPERLHHVPASIEVISGDDLRSRGAGSLRDALSLAAGVAIAPGGDGGPASAVPEFWGLREFDAFLLVVDGVPWGGALNPAVATLNLQDYYDYRSGQYQFSIDSTSDESSLGYVQPSVALVHDNALFGYVDERLGSPPDGDVCLLLARVTK